MDVNDDEGGLKIASQKNAIPAAVGGLIRVPLAVVTVLMSAATMVGIQRAEGLGWLAFLAIIPLLQIVRHFSPIAGAGLGALWGVGIASLLAMDDVSAAALSPGVIALLVSVPAGYVGLSALIKRRIGFNPFVLAVGWLLVEMALRPVGLPLGLVAGSLGGGALVSWVGGLLGYVFVAFLVIWASAAILSLIGRARIRMTLPRLLVFSPERARFSICRSIRTPVAAFAICQARPRAPPCR